MKRLDQDELLAEFTGITPQAQFRNEVDVLRTITHPCILRLVGYSTDVVPCIVYEFMEGGSLDMRLQRPIADAVLGSWAPLTSLERLQSAWDPALT